MVELAAAVMTDEFSHDFEKVCDFLQNKDVKYVEIRNAWHTNILFMNDEQLDLINQICKERGLKVASVSGGLLKCEPPSINPNPTENKSMGRNWKYNFAQIPNAIKIANKLKAPYIRCFGFHGKFKVPPVENWDSWNIFKEWKEQIEKMKKLAIENKKMFICENEGGLNKSLEHIEKIGKEVVGEGFGMLYDMANSANKYKKNGILTDEWLNRISKYIQFIHAKGSKNTFFNQHTTLVNGKGDICRWPEVVKYLKNMEKSEFIAPAPNPLIISIETHMGPKNRWKNSAKSLENLLNLLN